MIASFVFMSKILGVGSVVRKVGRPKPSVTESGIVAAAPELGKSANVLVVRAGGDMRYAATHNGVATA